MPLSHVTEAFGKSCEAVMTSLELVTFPPLTPSSVATAFLNRIVRPMLSRAPENSILTPGGGPMYSRLIQYNRGEFVLHSNCTCCPGHATVDSFRLLFSERGVTAGMRTGEQMHWNYTQIISSKTLCQQHPFCGVGELHVHIHVYQKYTQVHTNIRS